MQVAHSLLFVWVFLLCGACGAQKPTQVESSRDQQSRVKIIRPQGVTAADIICQQNSAEACNALDDNCDGVIDEGCGYASGPLQFTLSWDSGADIDLYVTDPSGETLFYNEENRRTQSGGHMDQDARGDCRPEQEHTRIENIYWEQQPPPGQYRVELHYFSPCRGSDATRTTLSISIENKIAGVIHFELTPEQRALVASFTL
jgi:tRNA (guanosine-2'-O-)-methyltransferase